jgi:hypothetical protein
VMITYIAAQFLIVEGVTRYILQRWRFRDVQ